MEGSVDVRSETCAFFRELAVVSEREYLKPAAVGEDRTVPSVEAVQAAGGLNHVESRTEVKMICVAQYDLGLHLLTHFGHVDRLYGAHSAYGHEYRGLYHSVVGGDESRSGRRGRIGCLKLEFHF